MTYDSAQKKMNSNIVRKMKRAFFCRYDQPQVPFAGWQWQCVSLLSILKKYWIRFFFYDFLPFSERTCIYFHQQATKVVRKYANLLTWQCHTAHRSKSGLDSFIYFLLQNCHNVISHYLKMAPLPLTSIKSSAVRRSETTKYTGMPEPRVQRVQVHPLPFAFSTLWVQCGCRLWV